MYFIEIINYMTIGNYKQENAVNVILSGVEG
jgi:hypothetical protein